MYPRVAEPRLLSLGVDDAERALKRQPAAAFTLGPEDVTAADTPVRRRAVERPKLVPPSLVEGE